MANLWLIDTDTLIKAKSSICTDKKDDYIDALCERLAEVNRNYQQITEVLHDYNLSDYSAEFLRIDIENLHNEIDLLKTRLNELENV